MVVQLSRRRVRVECVYIPLFWNINFVLVLLFVSIYQDGSRVLGSIV